MVDSSRCLAANAAGGIRLNASVGPHFVVILAPQGNDLPGLGQGLEPVLVEVGLPSGRQACVRQECVQGRWRVNLPAEWAGPCGPSSAFSGRQFPLDVFTVGRKRIELAFSGRQVGRSKGVAEQLVQHLSHRRIEEDGTTTGFGFGNDPDQVPVVGNDRAARVAVVDAIEFRRFCGFGVLIIGSEHSGHDRYSPPQAADAGAPAACAELLIRRV